MRDGIVWRSVHHIVWQCLSMGNLDAGRRKDSRLSGFVHIDPDTRHTRFNETAELIAPPRTHVRLGKVTPTGEPWPDPPLERGAIRIAREVAFRQPLLID